MDTVTHYRQTIRQLLEDIAQSKSSNPQIKAEVVIDPERAHYQLLYVGWDGARRVYDIAIHIQLVRDKVWIQRDNTDLVIAEALTGAGIPREAIVLGFRPERLRPYTDYAVT